jgi:hypothetical protein
MEVKEYPLDKQAIIKEYIGFLCDRARGIIPTGA